MMHTNAPIAAERILTGRSIKGEKNVITPCEMGALGGGLNQDEAGNQLLSAQPNPMWAQCTPTLTRAPIHTKVTPTSIKGHACACAREGSRDKANVMLVAMSRCGASYAVPLDEMRARK